MLRIVTDGNDGFRSLGGLSPGGDAQQKMGQLSDVL